MWSKHFNTHMYMVILLYTNIFRYRYTLKQFLNKSTVQADITAQNCTSNVLIYDINKK